MFYKKLLLIMFLSLSAFFYSYAQDENDTTAAEDTTWTEFHNHHWRFDLFEDEFNGRPTIDLTYGLSKLSQNGLNGSFANPNLMEVKLGYTNLESSWRADDILKYKFKYFLLSNISTNLSNGSSASNSYNTDLWRFGFGWASGYGYRLSSAVKIIPYYDYAIDWSQLQMKSDRIGSNDKSITDLYNNSFRFGTSTEGGIKINILPQIQIGAAYERSIIFPRHIFWKWVGSALVEAAGQWGIDSFVNKIMDHSPYAGPVVSFVLKNALSYGVYELRKEKMNWPFDSAAPLLYDQVKFGVTFVF